MDNSTLRIPDGLKHRVAIYRIRPIRPIVSYVSSYECWFVRRIEISDISLPISNFCSLSEKNSNSSDVPSTGKTYRILSRGAANVVTLSKCFKN